MRGCLLCDNGRSGQQQALIWTNHLRASPGMVLIIFVRHDRLIPSIRVKPLRQDGRREPDSNLPISQSVKSPTRSCPLGDCSQSVGASSAMRRIISGRFLY